MNGYDLTRNWYNFKFENISKVKSVHSDLYFYTVDLWNRLGQKKEFGLPTSVTMESLGIGSYNTYKKTLQDLIDFGFLKLIKESKNQYQSKIVALSKIDKALDKALDKAHDKALDKATDSIDKQRTKNNEIDSNESNKPKITFEERQQKFLDWFNNRVLFHKGKLGNFSILSKTTQNNLKTILKNNYTSEQLNKAFSNMYNSKWVKDNKMCTPTHFLVIDNFEKYLNQDSSSDNVVHTNIELN
jgi:hypothetical protein